MREATVEETIAAVHRLRKAGSKEEKTIKSEQEIERAIMKRKMDAARIIEDKRIDKDD
jgi:hypothetical protein